MRGKESPVNIDLPEAHQRFVVHVVAHLREQLPSAIQACASAMPGVLEVVDF